MRDSKFVLILILGCMTALSPFSIDMYLPSFQNIAADFQTTVAKVSLSLSSYFVGLSFGQLFYGPLLDRFGRKPPIYIGLAIYILASLLCLLARSTEVLVILRFVQAIGGCVVGVGSMAMVRDLFTVKESAKVYSLLILILGASPLLAPTIGGLLAASFGWKSVFIALAGMGTTLLLVIHFFLKESHQADLSVSLKVVPIFKNFIHILKNPVFLTFVSSGAIAFSGLFVYIAGSPVIFLETYKVSAKVYGAIFAIVAGGMILASQANVLLLKRFSNTQILKAAMGAQVIVGFMLCVGTLFTFIELTGTVFLLFLFLCAFGLTNPNSGALALGPFAKNAGSASALMGFMQMGFGALMSASVGALGITTMLPVVAIMAAGSFVALMVLIIGSRKISLQSEPI
jgi:MFS transporter, DHA1 family, multidrug resistance protein